MIIRKGEQKDMKSVLELIQELAVFEKEPDAVELTVADLERDGFGSTPLFHTFVAEIDEKIVGIALYYYRYSTWKGKTIHLEDLIVKENQRGSGIGFALYSKIIEQGKIDNVRRIEWAVLDWNIPAIEFYKKSGAKILEDWRTVQMNEQQISNFLRNLNS
jgi:GNAT superfamily N-acetyltransferase